MAIRTHSIPLPFCVSGTTEVSVKPINSPFRYAGGKFYARSVILPLIPIHSSYVEPLAGGASVFFAKVKAESNWLNDIDEELMNCLEHIRDNPEGLVDFLRGYEASKELHAYFKNEFVPKNDLERAARWYYLNRTSYSGIMNMKNCYWGYGDKYSMRPENWPRAIRSASTKLAGVRLTCLDFADVIPEIKDGSFVFIDPPYYNADQDKFYTHSFTIQDHLRLASLLKEHASRFRFLLTYDNSPEVRDLYSWCPRLVEQEWTYTINRTDDQTGKTNKRGTRYKGKELFILNY